MSKILMYSDLHIGADRVDTNKVISTLNWINSLATDKNVNFVFNLGDTFDFYNHTKSKMKITPSFISDLNIYGSLFKGHYILRGNHEFHEEGDLITILENYGAKVVIFPENLNINSKDILLMPYYEDIYISNLKFNFKKKYDYVFGHYDISGASFESGYRDPSKDSEVLSKFDFNYMYIGHYHIRQKIRSNIESIGSVQSRVKSENYTKMGITILDLDTGETEFIENPYADYNMTEDLKTVNKIPELKSKYNILEEIDNFKLEKSGLESIIEYVKSKGSNYDEGIVEYLLDYLNGLKN